VIFGLATLTRTVMLALLPAAVLAALVRLALARARPRQWVKLGAGLLVATLTASSWYTATWHVV
jgi:4-amino-4-deoxy-L-arabinose transferase-like glycosyltransferase